MLTPEQCQELMLDYLYGLLNPEEVQQFEAAVAAHPECAVALDKARRWQQMLAQAAKNEFPNVSFQAPAAEAVTTKTASVEPASISTATSRRGISVGWFWYAGTALAVLLAVAIPMGLAHVPYWKQQEVVAQLRTEVRDLEQRRLELRREREGNREQLLAQQQAAQQEWQEAVQAWRTALDQATQEIERKSFQVSLQGPERVQPGAANTFDIRLRRQPQAREPDQPPVKVETIVRDQGGKEVYRNALALNDQSAMLKLPLDLWQDLKSDAVLSLDVVAYDDEGRRSVVQEKIPLALPVYVTHLITDKPMYQPGETVYYRTLMLDRTTFQPPAEEVTFQFTIHDPSGAQVHTTAGTSTLQTDDGKTVQGPDGKPLRGVGCGAFVIPPELAGGEYTIKVVQVNTLIRPTDAIAQVELEPLTERKFLVNKYTPDKLNKKLEFDGKSYGAGDVVMARLEAKRARGGIPLADTPVQVRAVVDGQELPVTQPGKTDQEGVVRVRFTLPEKIASEDASLSVTFQDNEGPETIVRPIPLLLNRLQVEFFPEGGDLVVGVSSRVYYRARTPTGKPADLAGRIVSGDQVVAETATLTDADHPGVNQGLGMFTFTPEAGKRYELKLDRPKRIEGTFTLPPVKVDGVVLTIPEGVIEPNQDITLTVHSANKERELLVGAYVRGQLLDHQRITAPADQATKVTLKPETDAGGVVRVTVFEVAGRQDSGRLDLKPVAERLIFREQARQVELTVEPDKERYSPGGQVELALSATDEKAQPVPAVLLVGVVNQSVITMADDKTERQMPTHFLLGGEIQKPEELEHADFLLTEHPKAEQTLDLLLGTQGWRRFAEVDPAANLQEPEQVQRLLAATGLKATTPRETVDRTLEQVNAVYAPTVTAREEELLRAVMDVQAAVQAPAMSDKELALTQQIQSAEAELVAARDELDERDENRRSTLAWIILLGGGGLALGLLVVLGRMAVRQAGQPRGRLAGVGLVLTSLAIVSAVVLQWLQKADEARLEMAVAEGAVPGEVETRDGREDQGMVRERFAPRGEEPIMERDAANRALNEDRWFGLAPQAAQAGGGPLDLPLPPGPAGMPLGGGGGPAQPMEQFKAMLPGRVGQAPQFRHDQDLGRGTRFPVPRDALRRNRGLVAEARVKREEKPARPGERFFARPNANQLGMVPPQDFKELNLARDELGLGGFPGGAGIGGGGIAGIGGGIQKQGAGIGGFAGVGGPGFAPAGGPMPGGGEPMAGPGFGGFGGRRRLRLSERLLQSELQRRRSRMPLFVREYAHISTDKAGAVRSDFAETVFWHPVIVLPEDGRTKVSFSLSQDITQYRVLVAAHTLDGRVGATYHTIEARKPFSVDPKLPQEITSSDVIDVPVRVVNDSDDQRAIRYTFDPDQLEFDATRAPTARALDGKWTDDVQLAADRSTRRIYRFRAGITEGKAALRVNGTSDPAAEPDIIERVLTVVPEGFPVSDSVSGQIEGTAEAEINLPEQTVPGTLTVRTDVYLSTLADLQKGLEGLLREPHGCFEQTSSSNYPNIMILDYLESSDQVKPEVSARAKGLLDRGYQRLISFECQKPGGNGREGYEWFGGTAPPHEALTAYGLLQFCDLKRVYNQVDEDMVERTKQYLMGQRDGKGGFKRNPRGLDSFGRAPDLITNAYIVWALSESDQHQDEKLDLSVEIEAMQKQAADSEDPYFLALVANTLLNRDLKEDAVKLLERIADKQADDGSLTGTSTSITQSSGRTLVIETTALAVLGWLKAERPDRFTKPTRKAITWIGKQRSGGGTFGSTQSTILALKALIRYTEANRRPPEDGEMRLYVNGRQVASKPFTREDRDALSLSVPNPAVLKPGKNTVKVEMTTKHSYPFTVSWEASALKPASNEGCAVDLTTTLEKQEVTEGKTVRLNVKLVNRLDKDHGMATAIIGIPAGLKLPEDLKQLKKLTEIPEDGTAPRLGYFELRGTRELILYWRTLAAKQEVDLTLDLIANVPGQYRGPASRGYLYYDSDAKDWTDPLEVTIQPDAASR